jgi:hypothetical protein
MVVGRKRARSFRRKAQLAIEFVAATMIFLFAIVLVISSVFRAHSQASEARRSELLRLNAEKFSEILLGSQTNGFAQPDGDLNYTKMEQIPPNNYTALKEAVKTRDDYSFRVSYLPSLIIDTFFENALAKSPGSGAGYSFDSFSNSQPIQIDIFPRNLSGGVVPAETFVLLVNGSDKLVEMKLISAPESQVELMPDGEGIYTIKLLSYNNTEFLFGQKEITVGVVSR